MCFLCFFFARDIIAEQMFNTSQGYKIGGLGLTVEIDESMFGKVNDEFLFYVCLFV